MRRTVSYRGPTKWEQISQPSKCPSLDEIRYSDEPDTDILALEELDRIDLAKAEAEVWEDWRPK